MTPLAPPPRHHIVVRLSHWVGAVAMICLILSGWQIYNASPLLPFRIPGAITLGGWLGGAIAWHLTAMWLLMASGAMYLAYGFASGHFRRDLALPSVGEFTGEMAAALRLNLPHDAGRYNAVQRVFYAGVVAIAVLAVLTGLAIWKPVQFGPLTALFGDYDTARKLHFTMMVLIVGFLLIHLVLVAIVPRTLLGMITGKRGGV